MMSGFFSQLGRRGLFLMDPEVAHGMSITALRSGFIPTCHVPHDPRLQQTVAGHYMNKDKNGYSALSLCFPTALGFAVIATAGAVKERQAHPCADECRG